MHEHVTINLSSGVKKDEDYWQLTVLRKPWKEFKACTDINWRNIQEVTNLRMGRNVGYIRRVSESRIKLLCPQVSFMRSCRTVCVYRRSVFVALASMVIGRRRHWGIDGFNGVCPGEHKDARVCDWENPGTVASRWRISSRSIWRRGLAAVRTSAPVTNRIPRYREHGMRLRQADLSYGHGVGRRISLYRAQQVLSQDVGVIPWCPEERGRQCRLWHDGKLNYCLDSFRAQAWLSWPGGNAPMWCFQHGQPREVPPEVRAGVDVGICLKYSPLLLEVGFTGEDRHAAKENQKDVLGRQYDWRFQTCRHIRLTAVPPLRRQ